MKRKRGFTIVELLIVIVVIAILAAITVVAFNGIQARAKLTAQTADLDKIGKAVKLWSAESGDPFGKSGVGYNKQGYGGFTGTSAQNASYADVSVKTMLENKGYLTGSITAFNVDQVLLAPCTTVDGYRWVVMALVSPAPSRSVADQVADTGCTNSIITLYSDPNGTYRRNLIRVY